MTFQPRTPIFVFGHKADDVFVGATPAAVVDHVKAHIAAGDTLADFEIFDFDGTPATLAPEAGTFTELEPWEYLRDRMQRLAGRIVEAEDEAAREGVSNTSKANLKLAKGLAKANGDFTALSVRLAALTKTGPHQGRQRDQDADHENRDRDLSVVSPPHPGGPGHNLCHRLHLCD